MSIEIKFYQQKHNIFFFFFFKYKFKYNKLKVIYNLCLQIYCWYALIKELTFFNKKFIDDFLYERAKIFKNFKSEICGKTIYLKS